MIALCINKEEFEWNRACIAIEFLDAAGDGMQVIKSGR